MAVVMQGVDAGVADVGIGVEIEGRVEIAGVDILVLMRVLRQGSLPGQLSAMRVQTGGTAKTITIRLTRS
jgi:hypothetical protein